MKYSVNQLSKLAKVSVRTLHHYDDIGLVIPGRIERNGYRFYSESDVYLLQQVLFFKELGFSLKQIKQIVHSSHFDTRKALQEQKNLLELQKERIDALIVTLNISLRKLEGGELQMDDTQLFEGFDKKKIDSFKEEAFQKWGHTHAYKQSTERMKHWSEDDFSRIGKDGSVIVADIACLMDRPVDSTDVQELIGKYHKYINNFYDCSIEIFEGLGQGYIQDERFAEYFDNITPGLSVYMSQAITVYVRDQRGLK